jgi:hypothetical protein
MIPYHLRDRQHSQNKNLIGSNRAFVRAWLGLMAFGRGRWKHWNDVTLAAPGTIRGLFSPSALGTLDEFSLARLSELADGIRLLWRSGVYRQNGTETISMYIGANFGRI